MVQKQVNSHFRVTRIVSDFPRKKNQTFPFYL